MRKRAAVLVLSVLMAVVPLGACSQGPPDDAQDTPENLLATLLELREDDSTEDADQYFITGLRGDDWDGLTTVSEDILCSADGVDCNDKSKNNVYWRYVNNINWCEHTTAEEVREKGVEVDEEEDPGAEVGVEVVGSNDAGHRCSVGMRHIDGKWWIPA